MLQFYFYRQVLYVLGDDLMVLMKNSESFKKKFSPYIVIILDDSEYNTFRNFGDFQGTRNAFYIFKITFDIFEMVRPKGDVSIFCRLGIYCLYQYKYW